MDGAKFKFKITKRPNIYGFHGKSIIDRVWINNTGGQRHVIELEGITWMYESPQECEIPGENGQWYIDIDTGDQYLLCPGCGIDCT